MKVVLADAVVRMQLVLWRFGLIWPLTALAAASACALAAVVYVLQVANAPAGHPVPALAEQPAAGDEDRRLEAQSVAILQAVLAAQPDPVELLQAVHAQAQAEGLQLSRADYAQQQVGDLPVVRLRLTQPLTGSYPTIRRFARAVLTRLPTVSLDSMELRRESAAQAQVQAKLHFSLWLPVSAAAKMRQITGDAETAPARVPALHARSEASDASGTRAGATGHDMFSVRSWSPAPVPATAAPAPGPSMPAVPYAVLGKQGDAGSWVVFLGRADETLLAKAGDVLEGDWRVDHIAPPLMTLTYLPLSRQQTLLVGEAP